MRPRRRSLRVRRRLAVHVGRVSRRRSRARSVVWVVLGITTPRVWRIAARHSRWGILSRGRRKEKDIYGDIGGVLCLIVS